ncbi:MAG: hypothetical protein WBD63_00940 [Phycisphaerae bacterium]|nr:hypothetical protein [Phycisphaerae bacterium]
MRLGVRLGAVAVLLLGIALALVHLRTDVACAGNRLHSLFREKRALEKECGRLELAVAMLKSPERLREHATAWQTGESDRLPGAAVSPVPP